MSHMTREEFLDWADAQDQRYEFDGFQPVAMTGGTRNHSHIAQNIYFALRYAELRGSGCEPLGPDAGVATIGDAVRYPDGLVTCTRGPGTDRVVPGVVVVFEVLSATSGRTDRIDKLLEYQAVPSIRRYVILEHTSVGLTVHCPSERRRSMDRDPSDRWRHSAHAGNRDRNSNFRVLRRHGPVILAGRAMARRPRPA